ncbi:hypothetical protein [Staphylococcus pettenkoferi]|uniref:hypothetical protein n=1 Tax=Staphylococcus pettenkoferi TaxID=170573 RepID=UPI001F5B08B0|nr:hypothetical protein [Staphylococcus pettenkoferi]
MFSKHNKAAIGIALAYLSFIVGAGFTTGQELVQFYINHGNYAYIGAIITGDYRYIRYAPNFESRLST